MFNPHSSFVISQTSEIGDKKGKHHLPDNVSVALYKMYNQNEDMICGELFLRYEFIVRVLYRCLGSNINRLPPRTVSLLFCCKCAK